MENGKKSPEELSRLKETLRHALEMKLQRSVPGRDEAASLETESLSSGGARLVSEEKCSADVRDDDFWNLGSPKPRVYKKPDFSDAPVEMTDVEHTAEAVRRTAEPETVPVTADPLPDERGGQSSRLRYRPADNTTPPGSEPPAEPKTDTLPRPRTSVTADAEGRQTIVRDAPPRYQTSSYRHQSGFHPQKNAGRNERKRHTGNEILAAHHPGGLLLREVEVRSWTSDIDFYERFLENAEKSHEANSSVPYTSDYPPVRYFSYVPQYSHMSRSQLDFYRWIRENIRHGRYPDCDPSYIQLYIYEILNLPERIPPETGAAQLAGIWLHYRRTEPRFDGYLCEWLPDYCMIHNCPLPDILKPLLPVIVPKAQFKEFYFDLRPESASEEDYLTLAKTLIEASSDYDYRRSRYYTANRDAYEKHLPCAAASVIAGAIPAGTGVFSRERTYKMSRDSYCGAIVSVGVKRRLNIEFSSFTRSPETRRAVTAIVKYSENKLRLTLGIKAKLGVDGITPEDSAVIDAYFAPMLPQKNVRSKEDRNMPEDYLKNYEAEDSGFDFGTAAEIERASWQNTTLLTGGEFDALPDTPPEEIRREPPEPETAGEPPEPENRPEPAPENDPVENSASSGDGDDLLREALTAALNGAFHAFCRDRQIYDGTLADRINTRFLDIIGDVVLESSGGSYVIIEDYREDIETWMEE